MLSRTKPATGPGSQPTAAKDKKQKKKLPKLEELLDGRDYTGAQTLLEVLIILLGRPDCFHCAINIIYTNIYCIQNNGIYSMSLVPPCVMR